MEQSVLLRPFLGRSSVNFAEVSPPRVRLLFVVMVRAAEDAPPRKCPPGPVVDNKKSTELEQAFANSIRIQVPTLEPEFGVGPSASKASQ